MSTFRVVYKPTGELVLDAAERERCERREALRAALARQRELKQFDRTPARWPRHWREDAA